MKPIPSVLKNYWEDGITVERRYFPSISAAKAYAKNNGYVNYRIEKM